MSRSGRLATDLPAPRAPVRPVRRTVHGRTLEDPYAWLRDPAYPELRDPEVRAQLEAENAYFEAVMEPHADDLEALFRELRGRQKEDDAAVPWREGPWLYRWYFEKDAQYRTWARRPLAGGDESVLLDEAGLAAEHVYFRLGAFEPSPDGRLLAWSADTDGSERFTLRVRDLHTGADRDDTIRETLGPPVWTAGGDAFLYVRLNEAWRPWQVRLHRLGHPVEEDPVLYEEADEAFFVGVDETRDRAFHVISSGDHVTSELRVLPAHDPLAPPRLVAPRRPGHEYELDHAHGRFWIRTNDVHRNFRLVSAPAEDPGPGSWREEIAPSDDDYLLGLGCFADFLVLAARREAVDELRIRRWDGDEHAVALPEAVHAVGLGTNAEFETDTLRIGYTSMVTPDTVFDYHVAERRLEARKVREIPSGYDASRYLSERVWIEARDGVRVPVSLVRRRDLALDGRAPMHLGAYGAYGIAEQPAFSAARLSLLDRGFVCALAHVRGGDELGYGWYEAGKLERRENTFHDLVDVARGLIDRGYTAARRIAISGGSAGGELMGVVANRAPELWGAVIAHVPFVDVLNTMLDPDLPLTPIEWPEWGNPIESEAAFETIRAYCPYQNVAAQAYPPLLVTAGVNDPRVTYWEPAKWVARIRALRTNDEILLLKTDLSAGHGGRSGRWDALRELAEEYLFVLAVLEWE